MPLTTFLRDGRPTTYLRGLELLALGDIGYVVTPTTTSDLGGGGTTTWGTAGTTECRIDPAGGRSAVVAGRIDESSTYMIIAPADAVIDVEDRLVVMRGTSSEVRGTYAVTAAHERTGALRQRFEAIQV